MPVGVVGGDGVDRDLPSDAGRCHADPPRLRGPYWQWTRKVDGRPVTRQLPADQAERFRVWADGSRRLREALRALDEASAGIAEAELRQAAPGHRQQP